MIRIIRNSPSDVMRRAYRIYIDGIYRGKIKRNDPKSLQKILKSISINRPKTEEKRRKTKRSIWQITFFEKAY